MSTTSTDITKGLRIPTQIPLDTKTWVAAKSSITTLGIGNQLAFTYYDGLKIFCGDTKETFIWREVGVGTGLITPDFTYPNNTIVNGFDYSLKTYNLFLDVEEGVGGIGTTNTIAKWSAADVLTDSNLSDDGNIITAETDLLVNNVRVGVGEGGIPSNTVLGINALNANNVGSANTAIGNSSLLSNTTGNQNTAVGNSALLSNTTSSNNVGVGLNALRANQTTSFNVGIGVNTLANVIIGGTNTALGYDAGRLQASSATLTNATQSVFIGANTKASTDTNVNEIVIGYNVNGNGSNTVTIGNGSITNNYFNGNVRGGAFIKSGGTSAQFLMADGSVSAGPAGLGYLTYRAVINQVGTSAPTATVLYNDTLATVTWSRNSTGFYNATFSSGVLTASRSYHFISTQQGSSNQELIKGNRTSTTVYQFSSENNSHVLTDGIPESLLEIRIYT